MSSTTQYTGWTDDLPTRTTWFRRRQPRVVDDALYLRLTAGWSVLAMALALLCWRDFGWEYFPVVLLTSAWLGDWVIGPRPRKR